MILGSGQPDVFDLSTETGQDQEAVILNAFGSKLKIVVSFVGVVQKHLENAGSVS